MSSSSSEYEYESGTGRYASESEYDGSSSSGGDMEASLSGDGGANVVLLSDIGGASEKKSDVEVELSRETSLVTGLTAREVEKARAKHGFNEVAVAVTPWYMLLLKHFWGPMPWLIEAAAILSIVVGDYQGFGIILFLLLVNAGIGFHEEHHAGEAVAALQDALAPESNVLRDGALVTIPARELVPGDVIVVKGGDIIPADAVVVPVQPSRSMATAQAPTVKVDQAALTGESLPVSRSYGQTLLSSALVKTGEVTAQVTRIGAQTVIGKASDLVAKASKKSQVKGIRKTLVRLASVMLAIAFVIGLVIFIHGMVTHEPILDTAQLVLTILIAATPVAMPTVVTVTMAVGAHRLADEDAVVTDLTALEQLASTDILCSDKTGTLTQNALSLHECGISSPEVTLDDVLDAALFCSANDDDAVDHVFLKAGRARLAGEPWIDVETLDPIHATSDSVPVAISRTRTLAGVSKSRHSSSLKKAIKSLKGQHPAGTAHPVEKSVRVLHRVPFDPSVKKTEALVADCRSKKPIVFRVAKGASHVIGKMCGLEGDAQYQSAIDHFAARGYRTVAVASSPSVNVDDGDDAEWNLLGLFAISDPPRVDTVDVVNACHEMGIQIKMLTGDQSIIGRETARLIGIGDNIITASDLFQGELTDANKAKRAESIDGLGEVYPEHKHAVVELLQSRGHVVAMTGDGVNDAPAIKAANCGIAVEGATPAAQSAAAVVLLNPGLSAVVTAIREARRISQRLTSYVVFRILDSLHVLFFLAISILFLNFELEPVQVMLLALLNDLSLVSIAFDRAMSSPRPLKWNLPYLISMGVILSSVMVSATIATYYVAHKSSWGWELPLDETQTAVYLQISVSGHLAIFSTRVQDAVFLTFAPSKILVAGVVFSQVVATLLCGFGLLVTQLDWTHIGYVWAIAIATFVLVDYAKLMFHTAFEPQTFHLPNVTGLLASDSANTETSNESSTVTSHTTTTDSYV